MRPYDRLRHCLAQRQIQRVEMEARTKLLETSPPMAELPGPERANESGEVYHPMLPFQRKYHYRYEYHQRIPDSVPGVSSIRLPAAPFP